MIIFRTYEIVRGKKSRYFSWSSVCSGSPCKVFSRNANRKSITADVVRANNFAPKLDSPENEVDTRRQEERKSFEEKAREICSSLYT